MAKLGSLGVLIVSTFAFTICFAVWLMYGVTGIPIRTQLGLDSMQFGLLTATPVLTGALFRLPLGIWTDRFGGRIMMLILLVGCAIPLWVSSYATDLWQFLLLGLALGLVGASFSGGTPFGWQMVPRVYDMLRAAPTVPAPNTPIANPRFSLGKKRATSLGEAGVSRSL